MKRKLLSGLTLCDPMGCTWNSPGQNTGVGSLPLLRGIFAIQGPNPGFLHCRWILYRLSHKGSLRILEWVNLSLPFSSGSCLPKNWTRVSWIAGQLFTNWAIREGGYIESFSNYNEVLTLQKLPLKHRMLRELKLLNFRGLSFTVSHCWICLIFQKNIGCCKHNWKGKTLKPTKSVIA